MDHRRRWVVLGVTWMGLIAADLAQANCQRVRFNCIDIERNMVRLQLTPENDIGRLVISLESASGNSITRTITSQRGGADVTIANAFGDDGVFNNLPNGRTYTRIRADWTVNGVTCGKSKKFEMKVLNVYRHTQYNVPAQWDATCSGEGSSSVYITDNQCNFVRATLPEPFRGQVALNGRGRSNSYGIIQREFFCMGHPNRPPDAYDGYVFRRNGTIGGACGSIDETTVAVNPNHPDLSCDDVIYLRNVRKKTVTDLCGGCVTNQADNFTSDTRCRGIVDLGYFKTVKLFGRAAKKRCSG